MKKLIPFSLLLIAICACADNTSQQEEKFQQQAALKIKALANELKQALSASMQSGGPVAAVQTCKLEAPKITHALNDNLVIKRTSLKLRNPDNAPDAWEKEVLTSFETKLANGTPIDQLVHSETIKTENSTTLRMMRAIPTQGLCLTCHGDKQTMGEDLANALEESYPNDLATGFQAGQIRGAFSVKQTIEH